MFSNSPFYRITALSLALLMLCTSVGLAVNMHYCGGQLKTINLFGKAQTCHQAKKVKAPMYDCPMHRQLQSEEQGCMLDNSDCCQNKSLHIQLHQDQNIQIEGSTISKPLQQFITAYVQSFFCFGIEPAYKSILLTEYRPPSIPRDIPVLVQSFLL